MNEKRITRLITNHETDDVLSYLPCGMVLTLTKKQYPCIEEALGLFYESVDKIFKDAKVCIKTKSKQHSVQAKLYPILTSKA